MKAAPADQRAGDDEQRDRLQRLDRQPAPVGEAGGQQAANTPSAIVTPRQVSVSGPSWKDGAMSIVITAGTTTPDTVLPGALTAT